MRIRAMKNNFKKKTIHILVYLVQLPSNLNVKFDYFVIDDNFLN